MAYSKSRNLAKLLGRGNVATIPQTSISSEVSFGVNSYDSINSLPLTANSVGDLGLATNTKALYMWNGTAWDRVYTGPNQTPDWITTPATQYDLSSVGDPTTIQVLATDVEGFPITYSYDITPVNQTQAIISQDSSVFTITPSTNVSDAGNFTLRLKATDGLNVTARTTDIVLTFYQDIIFESTQPAWTTTTTNVFNYALGGLTSTGGCSFSNNLRLGKRYFEITNSGPQSYSMCGLAVSSFNGGWSTGGTDQFVVYYTNGDYYPGAIATGLGSPVNGIMMFAYDTDARLIWYGLNGTWSTVTGDPVTGAGYSLSGNPGDPLKILTGAGASGGTTFTGTLSVGSNNTFTYPIPTGFTAH